MRTLGRILAGAGVGIILAFCFLVGLVFVAEYGYAQWGWRYEDMTLAYFSWALLVGAPIVGGWLMWVRR